MKLGMLLSACLVFLLVLSNACSEETTAPVPPVEYTLVASPDTITMLEDSPVQSFLLSVEPQGELNWQISGKPDWIETDPVQGKIQGNIIEVIATANVSGLNVGAYGGRIQILSNAGGEAEVFVQIAVGAHPLATVWPTSLDFPDSVSQVSFTLQNSGTGFLEWSFDKDIEWLSLLPNSGTLASKDSIRIFGTVNHDNLAVGSYSGQVIVHSNSDDGDIELPVTMSVPSNPILGIAPGMLDFDYFIDTLQFMISNVGNSPFSWNASADETFLSLSIMSGRLQAHDSIWVLVSVERLGLTTGTYPGIIEVTNDANQAIEISTTLNHFENDNYILDHSIIDAEYDRNNDVIVTVSDAPFRLYVLDSDTYSQQSVSLPLAPTCVSIRPDGAYAAVGHNGFVSYINLSTITIENTYSVTTEAVDIILPSNGWVYVFPRTDQWERIRCVELTTGAETLHSGRSIRAGTLTKLHPSGDYIYGANNGVSPSDFEKYDIRGGTAVYMYDSPYHGDYSFGGNIWISDDGLLLFARTSNVFRSSTIQANDMIYAGNLANSSFLQWVEHSSMADRIYVVPANESQVDIYEPNFLSFQGSVELSQFLVPNGQGGGTLYDAAGKFVFVNSTGDKFHVLMKSESGSGLLLDWALATFDVVATP